MLGEDSTLMVHALSAVHMCVVCGWCWGEGRGTEAERATQTRLFLSHIKPHSQWCVMGLWACMHGVVWHSGLSALWCVCR